MGLAAVITGDCIFSLRKLFKEAGIKKLNHKLKTFSIFLNKIWAVTRIKII
jgi:hypothetical protein